jgi:hypothetical protein
MKLGIRAVESKFEREYCSLFFVFVSQIKNLGGNLDLDDLLTASLDAGKDILTVLVKLELGDDDVGGVDAERDGLAGGLVAGDALDVDDVLEAVDGSDLALLALLGAADNGDLVILADGDAADLFSFLSEAAVGEKFLSSATYVVLLTELLGERSAHDVAANAGRRLEVGLARLASRGRNLCTKKEPIVNISAS